MDNLYKWGIADGNRDIRSRLVLIPFNPQFKRFIPKYLDHSSKTYVEKTDALGNKRQSLIPNSDEDDIDLFTKTLIETGHFEIVDITKKEIVVEDQPELTLPVDGSLDDDDFGETPMEAPTAPPPDAEEPKKDGDSTAADTAIAGDATTATETTNKPDEIENAFDKSRIRSSHYNITASAFANPPDNSSSTLSLMHSAAAGLIEKHLENYLHVKAEGSRKCSMLLTLTHLILEYDVEADGLFEGEMKAAHEEAERQRMMEDVNGNLTARDEERISEEIERRQREAAALRPKSIKSNTQIRVALSYHRLAC